MEVSVFDTTGAPVLHRVRELLADDRVLTWCGKVRAEYVVGAAASACSCGPCEVFEANARARATRREAA